jgi:hypothetical protein
VSPQQAQTGPLWTGNSVQQTSQIGAEESCGSGEPQRTQQEGRRAQLSASMGLRSTRATARHREVPDGVTSNVSEPESLRKTHLASGWRKSTRTTLRSVYPDAHLDSIPFRQKANGQRGNSSRFYRKNTHHRRPHDELNPLNRFEQGTETEVRSAKPTARLYISILPTAESDRPEPPPHDAQPIRGLSIHGKH